MREYVIMTPSIVNMGGAQMYIRNKIVWLRKHGWDVLILSAHSGNILISELKEYDTFIAEMQFSVYLFPRIKRRKIVSKLIKHIQPQKYDEIVIESTCIDVTTWAEVVANEIKAKHISYLLQEDNIIDNTYIQEYFKFKYERRELVGITNLSLKKMFDFFAPIPLGQSYYLPAYCTNVVENIDSPYLHDLAWDKFDYKVGCLSRIDKPFVVTAVTSFVTFTQRHMDKKFLLFLIGGAPDDSGCVEHIKTIFTSITNVELVISGYMFPISSKLLERFDAFFSSAGSCGPCARSGVPTISIDGHDYMPIGIMNRTTTHPLFRAENEPVLDYQEVFENVIIKKLYKRLTPKHDICEPDFSDHMEFLNASVADLMYYDVCVGQLTYRETILKTILVLIGAVNYLKLSMLKRRLIS